MIVKYDDDETSIIGTTMETHKEPYYKFQPTTTPKSERLLAHTLGYPKTWHVVRKVITVPNDKQNNNSNNDTYGYSCIDTIYAGDPKSHVDTYYNHNAAYNASLLWNDETSTPYDNKGGQMMPVTANFTKGQKVQVLYDDGKWYNATITNIKRYQDDVRYTVHYTGESATQSNISQDQIRIKGPTNSGTSSAASKTSSKKSKQSESKNIAANKKQKTDSEALSLAKEMGLPSGWTVYKGSNYKVTIISADGSEKFHSKKAAFQYLDIPMSTPGKGRQNEGKSISGKKSDKTEGSGDVNENLDEEGDPPWRTSGHEYLGKRVYYPFPDEKGVVQHGTVTGWISDKDVDKNGDTGFVSEKTGEPACLFHVTFDSFSAIASQDLEEFELVEFLAKGEGEEKSDYESD